MSLIDINKISAMVTEHTEHAMQPLLEELREVKDLLTRLVQIEEAREVVARPRRRAG